MGGASDSGEEHGGVRWRRGFYVVAVLVSG
jgi:hypothetical protein